MQPTWLQTLSFGAMLDFNVSGAARGSDKRVDALKREPVLGCRSGEDQGCPIVS